MLRPAAGEELVPREQYMEQSVVGHAAREAGTRSLLRRVAPALILLAASILPYLATLGYGFVWDDHLILSHIGRASHDGGLLRVLSQPFLPTPDVPNSFYRPVVYFTYWLDRAIGGGLPVVAHATNVLVHAAVTFLVFAVGRRVLDDGAALAAGLVFAVHPVHVESVAWIAGRTDMLCAVFSLGAALTWIQAISSPGWRERAIGLASCAALFVLACLSKEAAVVLPLPLLIATWPTRGAPADDTRRRLGAQFAGALALVGAALTVLAIRHAALADELGQVALAEQLRDALLVAEPAVASAALLRLLRSLVMPWPHSALQARGDIGVDLVTIVSVVTLVMLGVVVLRRWRSGGGRLAVAWIATFALPTLLVSSGGVVVAAERYTYLPSIGACLMLGAFAGRARSIPGVTRAVRTVASVAIVAALAAACVARARVWASDDTLSADLVRTSPGSSLAHQIRGEVLAAEGRQDEAIASYERALALNPGSAPLGLALGRLLLRAGDAAGAARAFRAAVAAEPDWPDPHVGLAVACATLGDWTCVETERFALRSSPRDLATLDRILGSGSR